MGNNAQFQDVPYKNSPLKTGRRWIHGLPFSWVGPTTAETLAHPALGAASLPREEDARPAGVRAGAGVFHRPEPPAYSSPEHGGRRHGVSHHRGPSSTYILSSMSQVTLGDLITF